jgi:hypothetical protein
MTGIVTTKQKTKKPKKKKIVVVGVVFLSFFFFSFFFSFFLGGGSCLVTWFAHQEGVVQGWAKPRQNSTQSEWLSRPQIKRDGQTTHLGWFSYQNSNPKPP